MGAGSVSTRPGRVVVVSDRVNAPLFRSVGLKVYEAEGQDEVLAKVRSAASENAALVIVLKHLLEDEEAFQRQVERLGVTVLVLPTLWAKAEPINVEKILARALGLG